MKRFTLGIVLSAALLGCSDKDQLPAQPTPEKQAAADVAAGKAFAERECKACHGLDGKGAAPGIPHLAAQRERYLLAALKAYKEGKRTHAALKVIADRMSEAEVRNVAAYYAGLPAEGLAQAKDVSHASPFERGKARAADCAKCHGTDGNGTAPGIPSLAGQQVRYLIVALQEYVRGERRSSPMHAVMRTLSPVEMEAVAIFFASHARAERAAPSGGDVAAGAALSAVCSGCHGLHGVSADSVTPNLAGQDYKYLVGAIRAYRTTRKREKMRLYITGLKDKDIQDIAAFYATQKSGPAERGQTMVRDLTEKCDRCHAAGVQRRHGLIGGVEGHDALAAEPLLDGRRFLPRQVLRPRDPPALKIGERADLAVAPNQRAQPRYVEDCVETLCLELLGRPDDDVDAADRHRRPLGYTPELLPPVVGLLQAQDVPVDQALQDGRQAELEHVGRHEIAVAAFTLPQRPARGRVRLEHMANHGDRRVDLHVRRHVERVSRREDIVGLEPQLVKSLQQDVRLVERDPITHMGIERGAHAGRICREPLWELLRAQPAPIFDVLGPHEVTQRDDRLYIQLAQAEDDGPVVIEDFGVEFARSRLDARPGDGKAKGAAAHVMRVVDVLAPAMPEIGRAPARHDTRAPFPRIPEVGRVAFVVRFRLVIGNRYAEEERIG